MVGVPRGLGLPGQGALCAGSMPGTTRRHDGCEGLDLSPGFFSLFLFIDWKYLSVDCTLGFNISSLSRPSNL